MALTVTNNMTKHAAGDSTENVDVAVAPGWFDLDNVHADFGALSLQSSLTADFYEGDGCMAIATKTAATTCGYVYRINSTNIDMSGTMFVRVTAKFGEVGKMGTKAQDGVQVIVVDSANNYRTWTVDGSDTYSGAWEQWLVDLSTTHSTQSSTAPVMTNILYIGVCSYYVTKPARSENMFIDAVWYGSDPSVTVTGTVVTAGEGWSELEGISQAVARRDGVVRFRNGIYEIRGGIKFNNTTTGSVDFSDDQNSKLRFVPAPIGSLDSVSEILIQGNATGTTDFELGNLVGGAGLLGGTFFSPSVLFTFDSDTNAANIDSCNLYGVTFEGAGIIAMDDSGTTTQAMTSCQVIGSKQFAPGAASTSLSSFISTTSTAGALLWNESIDISDCQFIANTTGADIEHPSAAGTPYTHTNLTHSGSTYHVNNTSGSAISVAKVGTSNPTTYTGSLVTYTGSVNFTLTNVVSGSTFTLDGAFTTATPATTYNGTGDSVIRFTGTIPSVFATSGTVRLFNGTYYEKYTYTGVSTTDLTGVSPTLSQDFDGSNALLPMVSPTSITVDPYTVGVEPSQNFEAMLANQATTRYIPIQFADTTGTGFSRRIQQIEE